MGSAAAGAIPLYPRSHVRPRRSDLSPVHSWRQVRTTAMRSDSPSTSSTNPFNVCRFHATVASSSDSSSGNKPPIVDRRPHAADFRFLASSARTAVARRESEMRRRLTGFLGCRQTNAWLATSGRRPCPRAMLEEPEIKYRRIEADTIREARR